MAKELLILAAILGIVAGELADFRKCADFGDDICNVTEVRITPCHKQRDESCRMVKGTTAVMEFDYIPKFSSDNLITTVFWMSSMGDLPFESLNRSPGCVYTSCPIEAGQNLKFTYNLPLSKKLPKGKYPLRWILSDANDETKTCCYTTKIELTRT